MPDDSDFVDYVSARLARLHRAAYLMCGDTHRADDLVQATLVSLYARWNRARTADNLDGYVHRILVRRFIDEKRSRWSRVLLRPTPPESPAADSYTESSPVLTALRRLPPGQRAVIVLRYVSDLSVEQTAHALGCSTGNVKSQCARGLATLRDLLTSSTVRTAHRLGDSDDH
ncbi:MAG TPA: SigE family RNA polymerase sigma factor [Micromonosporaceae bacterium]|jgi:RNA polymerase sigma-70 factor (sigma-E family)